MVLGGGFAGVDCTRKLESYFQSNYNIEITLVSDDNFLLFTPMLPQVASGTITPRHIVMPLRGLCKKARIYESAVRDIDPIQKHVTLEGTPEKRGVRIHYDYLVIALGSQTNFFGLRDDKKIKQRLLTFVIVGGGFAGIETAGEVNDFLHDALDYYHNIKKEDISVIVIEALPNILPGFNEKLAKFAHKKLEEKGIKILLKTTVTSFDGKNVTIDKLTKPTSAIKSKTIISSHTLVWTAGVTPVEIIKNSLFKTKKGQIIVNKFLEIDDFSGVFAIGDCSRFDEATYCTISRISCKISSI